jgi:hypothetical protein
MFVHMSLIGGPFIFGSFQFCLVFCIQAMYLCEMQNHLLFECVLLVVPNKVKKSALYADHVCPSVYKPLDRFFVQFSKAVWQFQFSVIGHHNKTSSHNDINFHVYHKLVINFS